MNLIKLDESDQFFSNIRRFIYQNVQNQILRNFKKVWGLIKPKRKAKRKKWD